MIITIDTNKMMQVVKNVTVNAVNKTKQVYVALANQAVGNPDKQLCELSVDVAMSTPQGRAQLLRVLNEFKQ